MDKKVLVLGGVFLLAVLVGSALLFNISPGMIGKFVEKTIEKPEVVVPSEYLEPIPFGNEEDSRVEKAEQIGEETPSRAAQQPKVVESPIGKVKMRIFISSKAYTGNLQGLSGADRQCQELAENAELEGTFKTWLSTLEVNAGERFDRSDTSYSDILGVRIANNFNDLANGNFVNLLKTTETGESLPAGILVWTGTENGGMKKGDTKEGQPYCTFWRAETSPLVGSYGQTAQSGAKWTDAGTVRCSRKLRLYCIED